MQISSSAVIGLADSQSSQLPTRIGGDLETGIFVIIWKIPISDVLKENFQRVGR